jgi:hypothetical protein
VNRKPSRLVGRRVAAATAVAAVLAGPAPVRAQAPIDGEVQSFYFDTLGYTEVWVNLTPAPRPGETMSAVRLNLTVRLPGRASTQTPGPPVVVARAESNGFYNPAFIRQPVLAFDADGRPAWDAELPVRFFERSGLACVNCGTTADTVEVQVPPPALEALASARKVTGNALGFAFELSDAQIEAVRRLVETAFR